MYCQTSISVQLLGKIGSVRQIHLTVERVPAPGADFRIPLAEGISVGKEPLLAALFLITPGTAKQARIGFFDRVQQCDLQSIGLGFGPVPPWPARHDLLLYTGHDQIPANIVGQIIAKLDRLIEVMTCIDGTTGKATAKKPFAPDAPSHGSLPENSTGLPNCAATSHGEDRFRLQLLQVGELISHISLMLFLAKRHSRARPDKVARGIRPRLGCPCSKSGPPHPGVREPRTTNPP